MRSADAARPGARRWGIVGIAVVVTGTAALAATYTPLFGAGDIRVKGAGAIPRDEILTLAGLGEGSNVFHLDTLMVEGALERDPRILQARVTTSLPDRVSIAISRRLPVAVAGTPATLVGADGVVIGPALGDGADLPILSSADGGPPTGDRLEAAAAAAAAMSPALRSSVESVVVGPEGELEVRIGTGFTARFGEATELEAKAASLRALLDWADDLEVSILSADLTVPGSPTAQLHRGSAAVPEP
jgi:cell division septal protein FtsQ